LAVDNGRWWLNVKAFVWRGRLVTPSVGISLDEVEVFLGSYRPQRVPSDVSKPAGSEDWTGTAQTGSDIGAWISALGLDRWALTTLGVLAYPTAGVRVRGGWPPVSFA
jgi:hypothetical protein